MAMVADLLDGQRFYRIVNAMGQGMGFERVAFSVCALAIGPGSAPACRMNFWEGRIQAAVRW